MIIYLLRPSRNPSTGKHGLLVHDLMSTALMLDASRFASASSYPPRWTEEAGTHISFPDDWYDRGKDLPGVLCAYPVIFS
jgi:hypothetical protein